MPLRSRRCSFQFRSRLDRPRRSTEQQTLARRHTMDNTANKAVGDAHPAIATPAAPSHLTSGSKLLLLIGAWSGVVGALLAFVANGLHPHPTDFRLEALLQQIADSSTWGTIHLTLRVADALETAQYAVFSLSIVLFLGLGIFLYGLAIVLGSVYPKALGWLAMLSGAGAFVVGIVQALSGPSFRGSEFFFVLFSVLSTIWVLIMGVIMGRKAQLRHANIQGVPLPH